MSPQPVVRYGHASTRHQANAKKAPGSQRAANQGFVPEEDIAFRALVANYEKASRLGA